MSSTPEISNLPSPEGNIDFSQEATVAYNLTEQNGIFVELPSGEDASSTVIKFSRMKYGHFHSTEFFADHLSREALANPSFISFIREAEKSGTQVYITSPGIYNVSSASNVLLRNTAARLNISLSQQRLPTVLIAEQTRLGESNLAYARQGIDDRGNDSSTRSILPEKFRDSYVIYLDDIYISGTVAERAKRRLYDEAKVRKAHFLLGMRIDPEVVARTDGKIEHVLNTYAVDESLTSIQPILNSEFVPVQKTLQVIFNPANTSELEAFLMNNVPNKALAQLYVAAANNDFRNRWDGKFEPGIDIMANVLRKKGMVRPDGSLLPQYRSVVNKTEYAQDKKILKTAVHTIAHKNQVPREFAEMYSRMKYSDPEATRYMAEKLFENIWNNQEFRAQILHDSEVCISSSPYGEIPTAAACIVSDITPYFEKKGIKVSVVKVQMAGDFSTTNYGEMTPEERMKCMNGFALSLDEQSTQKIKDKFVLVIDDLNATGSHERPLHAIFEDSPARSHAFSYLIDFDELLAFEDSKTEEFFNNHSIHSVLDLIPLYTAAEAREEDFPINARTIKFILSHGEKNPLALTNFFNALSDSTVQNLYKTASSIDGYSTMPKLFLGAQLLENHLLAKNLLSVVEVSNKKDRVVGFHITLQGDLETATIVDMATGEVRDDIGYIYSLMKFGGVKEIKAFASIIAERFIAKLDNPNDPLSKVLAEARQENKNIMHIIPGSRNVESASYYIHQAALDKINLELALRDLPTIVSLRPPRLKTVAGEYASYGTQERQSLPEESDHILPGKELYRFPIHVLFADDIRITGSTADAVERSAVIQGAHSFTELYALVMDGQIAHQLPKVESWLNSRAVKGSLDETIRYILNQEGFQPVQRLLRLVFNPKNRAYVHDFFSENVDDNSILSLYKAALINDYLKDDTYAPSVRILQNVLIQKHLVDINGRII